MKEKGECGVLLQKGRQVGGFGFWEINYNISGNFKGQVEVSNWHGQVKSYWLNEAIKEKKFQARFYQYNKHAKNLILFTRHVVLANKIESKKTDNLVKKIITFKKAGDIKNDSKE